MPANVEAITFVTHGTGDAADILGIGFKNRNLMTSFRQIDCGRQTRRTGSDDDHLESQSELHPNLLRHFIKIRRHSMFCDFAIVIKNKIINLVHIKRFTRWFLPHKISF